MAKVEYGLGAKKPKKGLGSATELIGDEETEEYVQRAYDFYAKPYQQQFEALGEATRKEAIGKGLYLSGSLAKATDKQMDDYSRQVAENVVMPLAREGMDRSFQARQQAEAERAAKVQEGFRTAELTGYLGGSPLQEVSTQTLGLNADAIEKHRLQQSNQMPDQWNPVAENMKQQIATAFAVQTGREATQKEIDDIFSGKSTVTSAISTVGQQTLGEEQRQFNVTQTGRISGSMGASQFNVPMDLLSDVRNEIDQGITNGESFMQAKDIIRDNSVAQGVYITDRQIESMLRGNEVNLDGAPTLDLQRMEDQREQFQMSIDQDRTLSDAQRQETKRQFDVQNIRRQIEWKADVTGRLGGSSVTAEDLGIDLESWLVPNEIGEMEVDQEIRDQVKQDLIDIAGEAGLAISEQQAERILNGESSIVQANEDLFTLEGRRAYNDRQDRLYESRREDRRLGLDEDIADLNERIANAEITGIYLDENGEQTDQTTLIERKMILEEARGKIEQESLNLEVQKERNRVRDNYAQLTGIVLPLDISQQTLGVSTEGLYDEDGRIQHTRFAEIVSEIERKAPALLGRNPTETEIQAIIRGQSIVSGDPIDTLARQVQMAEITGKFGDEDTLERVLAEAQLTGYLGDSETLDRNRFELEEQIQKRVQALNEQAQAFSETMTLMQERGYMEVGAGGAVTAEELGINTAYVQDMNPYDILETYEAEKLSANWEAFTGEKLSEIDIYRMLTGGSKEISQPIRIETLSARAQRENNELEVGKTMGTLGNQKTQAAKEFDENLSLRKDVTKAEVANINAGITRADRELEAQITQWVAGTNLDIAAITGQFGISGDITAEELGVVLPEGDMGDSDYRDWTIGDSPEKDALTQAFNTTFGREPSSSELIKMLQKESISVESTPTLAGRQLSQLISTQSLEIANDMEKFSKQMQLERDEFLHMQTEFEQTEARLNEQMSNEYGLNQAQFALARQEVEAKHTGKWNVSGKITAADLGIPDPISSPEPQDIETIMNTYEMLTGKTIDNHTARRMLTNPDFGIQSDTTWTQDAIESARNHNLDTEKFTEAINQYNRNFEEEQKQAWMQLTGKGYDPTKTRYNPDTGKDEPVWMYTQGYKAYWDSRQDLEKVNDRRDMIWNSFTQDALDKNKFIETARFKASNYGNTIEEQSEGIIQAFVDRYGYEPSRQEVGAALSGEVSGVPSKSKLIQANYNQYDNITTYRDASSGKALFTIKGKDLNKNVTPKYIMNANDVKKTYGISTEGRSNVISSLGDASYNKWYDKDGKPIAQKGILALDADGYLKIDVYGFGTGNAFEEEMSRLNNIVSGHALQVTEAVSGWEQAGQVAGAIVGQAAQGFAG